MKRIKKIIKKIKDLVRNKSLTKYDEKIIIKNTVLMNLKLEKIIFKDTKKNPIIATKKLSNCGFKNFKQLNGGFSTDFDKPFRKFHFFNERFGSGDLRILCQKK